VYPDDEGENNQLGNSAINVTGFHAASWSRVALRAKEKKYG